MLCTEYYVLVVVVVLVVVICTLRIVFIQSVRRLLVIVEVVPRSPILFTRHPHNGGATFFQNVGYYKSHTA
jgi:hypothetical protein